MSERTNKQFFIPVAVRSEKFKFMDHYLIVGKTLDEAIQKAIKVADIESVNGVQYEVRPTNAHEVVPCGGCRW